MSQEYTPVEWVDETATTQGTTINKERLDQMQTAHHYADGFEEVDTVPSADPLVDYHKVVYCTADATFYRWDGSQWTKDVDDTTKALLEAHEADHSNPHAVTKAQVGLGNADNTSDADKPISTATQVALNLINGKIPAEASASNQLADKAFVNSSISTNTANFLGTYDAVTGLGFTQAEADLFTDPPDAATQTQVGARTATAVATAGKTATNNDYVFISVNKSTTIGNDWFWRFKYNGSAWVYEFTLNNSSFTAAQWATINSGLTASNVAKSVNGTLPDQNGAVVIPVGTALVKKSITLTAAGWSNNAQTVSITGLLADDDVLVAADPADYDDWNAAGVRAVSQAAGSITFECTAAPSTDLAGNVVIGRLGT